MHAAIYRVTIERPDGTQAVRTRGGQNLTTTLAGILADLPEGTRALRVSKRCGASISYHHTCTTLVSGLTPCFRCWRHRAVAP